MKKYLITILTPKTGYNITHQSDEYTIDHSVDELLGGWSNIQNHAMTSSYSGPEGDDDFQMTGRTKDNDRYFSILCYESEN